MIILIKIIFREMSIQGLIESEITEIGNILARVMVIKISIPLENLRLISIYSPIGWYSSMLINMLFKLMMLRESFITIITSIRMFLLMFTVVVFF